MPRTEEKKRGSATLPIVAAAAALAAVGGVAYAVLSGKGGSKTTPQASASRSRPKGSSSKPSKSSARGSGSRGGSKASSSRAAAAAAAAEAPADAAKSQAAAGAGATAAAAAGSTAAAGAAAGAAAAAQQMNDAAAPDNEPMPTDVVPEGAEEEEEMIELQEGETVPVVDEDGNELGLLQHDGSVVDKEGNVIGGLDDEGQVVLYGAEGGEQEAQPELTEAEQQAENFMRQAAVSWNVHGNKQLGEKYQRKALEAVTSGEARPEVVAEVASTLADMLYSENRPEEALEAVTTAMEYAEKAENWALYVKLSNNMGAVLRKLEKHEEGKELHTKALDIALQHFGREHPTATLARGNLVDCLDQLGETDAARNLLREFIDELLVMAEKREAEMPPDAPQPSGAGEEALSNTSERLRPRTAACRAYIELGRLEMKAKDYATAKQVLGTALVMARESFGEQSQEAAAILAVYASCHRQAGELDAAMPLYEELYNLNEAHTKGEPNQSSVMLARSIAEMMGEAGRYGEAATYSQKALTTMQAIVGVRAHPLLEPFFNQLSEMKAKAGDEAGAEEVRKSYLKGLVQLKQSAGRGQGGAGGAGASGSAPGLPKRKGGKK